jgi:hypothetical protein
MKLKIKMNLVQKVKFSYPEFEIETTDFPELEGKTLDEMREYIEEHGESLHPIHEEFDNLKQELSLGVKTLVLESYPDESKFYVVAEDEIWEEVG